MCGGRSATIIGSLGVRSRMMARCGSNGTSANPFSGAGGAAEAARDCHTRQACSRIMRVRFRGK